jgi:hypothetical protein
MEAVEIEVMGERDVTRTMVMAAEEASGTFERWKMVLGFGMMLGERSCSLVCEIL